MWKGELALLYQVDLARIVSVQHRWAAPWRHADLHGEQGSAGLDGLLAERAQMTKQAMAELVQHLETHGYVRREPDPTDRRAKLVVPTDRGHEVIAVAQGLAPEIEHEVGEILGAERVRHLRADLEAIRREIPSQT
jgi:DNA-binding HxlR family transcriptional regulator